MSHDAHHQTLILHPENTPLLTNNTPPRDNGPASSIQTIFNMINAILGVGVLSFPFALQNTGWSGLLLLVFLTASASHTAKLLGRCLKRFPHLKSYPDISFEAFGERAQIMIGIIFFVELFLICVTFLIISADNLNALFQSSDPHDITFWILIVSAIVLPSTWAPNLSWISYFSFFGILATLMVFLAVLFKGFQKQVSPGSILHPSSTYIFEFQSFPLALGLMMSGYAGHTVFPDLYCSMASSTSYESAVDVTFIFCMLIYGAIASCGYLMYGKSLNPEITLNFAKDDIFNLIATWATVLNPITKFTMALIPCMYVPFPDDFFNSSFFSVANIIERIVIRLFHDDPSNVSELNYSGKFSFAPSQQQRS